MLVSSLAVSPTLWATKRTNSSLSPHCPADTHLCVREYGGVVGLDVTSMAEKCIYEGSQSFSSQNFLPTYNPKIF